MRKASFLVGLIFAASVGSVLTAAAGHCGSGSDRQHDPFNSCENGTPGRVECSSGTTIPMVGVVTLEQSNGVGVQGCAEDSSALPVAGRGGVWVNGTNVTVFVDGDDETNQSDAKGWNRVDVRAEDESCKVRARRGSQGQWANQPGGDTSSQAETDQCIG